MVDLTALRSLTVLESAGTVAATGDLLGFTPSAVSQQLRRLERQLGVRLTERAGRRVVLTPAGQVAARRARGLLDDLENLRGDLGDPALLRGEVRLAGFSTAERGIVAPATGLLRRTAPDLDLHVVEHDPPQALAALERAEVDLALVHTWVGLPTHVPEGVATLPLGDDVADLVVPADHPLAERDRVTPAALHDATWTCVHVGSVCHRWLVQMFAGQPAPPRVRFWTSEFASQLAYVAAGSAVALLPRLGRGPLPGSVVAVPIEDPTPRRPVHLAWRRTRAHDPLLQHVRAAIAQVAADAVQRSSSSPFCRS